MLRSKGWILLFVVVVVGAFGWWALRSDESVIKARLREAADALSTGEGEPEMQRLLRLASFAKILAPDVVVEDEARGVAVRGREAVAGLAAQLARAGGPRQLSLRDIRVEIGASGAQATAFAVPEVTPADGRQLDEGAVVRFELARVDGEWLITRAAPELALSR